MAHAFSDWIGLDGLAARTKDTNVYKNYTSDVMQAMLDETSTFVRNVAFGGDGLFTTLFAAHNRLLASISNMMGVPSTGFGDPTYSGTLTELG